MCKAERSGLAAKRTFHCRGVSSATELDRPATTRKATSATQLLDSLIAKCPTGSRWKKFNAAALVRTDLLTRYQAHESAIRAGWKLRSEVRDLEDLPPIPGIDDTEPPSHEVGAA